MAMPDEACSVSLFKHSMKSFTVNIYGEPKRHPLCNLPDPPNSQSSIQKPLRLPTTNSVVISTKSLTFITSRAGETQELTLDVRNRTVSEVQVLFSRLFTPFRIKTRSSTLKPKNRGTLRIEFTAQSEGRWEDTLTISTEDQTFTVQLIGKCNTHSTAAAAAIPS